MQCDMRDRYYAEVGFARSRSLDSLVYGFSYTAWLVGRGALRPNPGRGSVVRPEGGIDSSRHGTHLVVGNVDNVM